MIPYADENADQNLLSNTEDIREKIIADLREGTSLPDDMGAIGRFNGIVSKVLLAKALMQMNHDYSVKNQCHGAVVCMAPGRLSDQKM